MSAPLLEAQSSHRAECGQVRADSLLGRASAREKFQENTRALRQKARPQRPQTIDHAALPPSPAVTRQEKP